MNRIDLRSKSEAVIFYLHPIADDLKIQVAMRLLAFALHTKFILLATSFTVTDPGAKNTVKVPMRIVKDTASYGYFGGSIGEAEIRDHLIAKVKPSNVSGPALLHRLLGLCYNVTLDRYRYSFCPFQNMTQYEISSRWNAYQGVIGIWDQWIIENNTFTAMLMSNGDPCGNTDRSVKVFLKCSSRNELVNVTEPKRCQYSAVFNTKLVCHKDALLVYPRLTPELKKKWDSLFTEFYNGDLSKKGYEIRLQELFEEAHFTRRNQFMQKNPKTEINENVTITADNLFSDVMTCNKEYNDLKKEVLELHQEMESLKLLFDLSKVQGADNKSTVKN